MSDREPMISADNLVKIYKTGELEVVALQGLDLLVEQQEIMAIIGNSGSGKSTLMNIIGGLDKPSAGRISVAGRDLLKLNDKDLIRYRREVVGFIWQNTARNLIPYLSAEENVEVPMILAEKDGRREQARKLLDIVGLTHRRKSKLEQLSGGEQQRVAIAIGLANEPALLLADEPTGNVDTVTTDSIFAAFRDATQQLGVTIVIVTHDRRISRAVDRVVAIRDGRTSSEFIRRETYADRMQSVGDLLQQDDTHEEFAVVDRAGRLQIPQEFLESIGLEGQNKVRVTLDGRRIVLEPPEEEPDREEAP